MHITPTLIFTLLETNVSGLVAQFFMGDVCHHGGTAVLCLVGKNRVCCKHRHKLCGRLQELCVVLRACFLLK